MFCLSKYSRVQRTLDFLSNLIYNVLYSVELWNVKISETSSLLVGFRSIGRDHNCLYSLCGSNCQGWHVKLNRYEAELVEKKGILVGFQSGREMTSLWGHAAAHCTLCMSKIPTELKTMTGAGAPSRWYGHPSHISILDKRTLTIREVYKYCTLEPHLTSVRTVKDDTDMELLFY